jgi:hypothetical protein
MALTSHTQAFLKETRKNLKHFGVKNNRGIDDAARAHLENCDRVAFRTCSNRYNNALREARAHVQAAFLAIFRLVANFFFENDERANGVNCVGGDVALHERHRTLKRANEFDGRIVWTLIGKDASPNKTKPTNPNKAATAAAHHSIILALEHLVVELDNLVYAHQERGFPTLRVLHQQLRWAANGKHYMHDLVKLEVIECIHEVGLLLMLQPRLDAQHLRTIAPAVPSRRITSSSLNY